MFIYQLVKTWSLLFCFIIIVFFSFAQILLLNFRNEILPFIPKSEADLSSRDDNNDDCSDILVVSDYMAIAAHNEDANVALLGHT